MKGRRGKEYIRKGQGKGDAGKKSTLVREITNTSFTFLENVNRGAKKIMTKEKEEGKAASGKGTL